MRGKAFRVREQRFHDGITPAYAGKRPVLQDSKNDMEDHPRLCGEKLSFCEFRTHAAGSPPPMRGKV